MVEPTKPEPRGPEKVPLPPPPTPETPHTEAQGLPFSTQLQGARAEMERQRDGLLLNQRQVRLRDLETKRTSRVIVYYSFDIIYDLDAQLFYELLSRIPQNTDIDLILSGPGGLSDPAYKIARLCQDHVAKNGKKFTVLIPYAAKSALTILSLGASEILMGPTSELGPIDPQILLEEEHGTNPYPLLGIQDAIDFIQERVKAQPEMALLFMPLMEKLGILSLGAFSREIESAKQYATELLEAGMLKGDPTAAKALAEDLTSRYKRHGHVIDRTEARRLGLKVCDAPQDQWEILWQLHKLYEDYLKDPGQQRHRITTIIESKDFSFKRPIAVWGQKKGNQKEGESK